MLNEYLYLKNGAERKYIVIKIDDLIKFVKAPVKLALLDNDLKDIQAGRKSEGKEPIPEYLVVNTDEPYADLVKKLILNEITAESLIPKILSKRDLKLLVNSLMEDSVSIIAQCEECKNVMGKTYDEEKKRADRLIYLANVLDGRKEYRWGEEK